MYRVMLVDDMEISLRQIKRMKLWNGETNFCIAAEAKNGQEALDILKNNPIDLLITDIKMPKVDGIELLKEVMESELCPCVVLLSDYEDFTYARLGIQFGAFDYLSKPANIKDMLELLERVGQLLDKKKREVEMLRSLEEKLEEKIEDRFPAAELEHLIEAIRQKSPETSKITDRLTNTILVLFDKDLIKTGTALKKALSELVQKLREQHEWLDKFIDPTKYRAIDFSGMQSSEESADIFKKSVISLYNEIGNLEYGYQDEQIEYRICRHALERVDSSLTIEDISKILFMNRSYVSEVFRQKTGELLIEYITRIKMRRAARLLEQNALKAYEIALLIGFKDTEYFSRIFKKYMGMSPSAYRNTVAIKTNADIIRGKY